MKILLTGASGNLGMALLAYFQTQKTITNHYEWLTPSSSEFDLLNIEQIKQYLQINQPEIIIHCAALTDGKLAKTNPEIFIQANSYATKNIAEYCANAGARCIFISTQSVFGQYPKDIYYEGDKIGALDNYSLSKQRGEEYLQQIIPNQHVIIRLGRLMGYYPHQRVKFFQYAIDALRQNPPTIEAVADEYENISSAVHVAKFIERALTHQDIKLYHLVSKGGASRYDIMKKIADYFQVTTEIIPISLQKMQKLNNVPNRVNLLDSRYHQADSPIILPHQPWQDDVGDYCQSLNLSNLTQITK